MGTICVPFVLPALRRVCLPFVPATNTQLANVRLALRGRETVKSKPTLLDIGSGDGRIVIQSAQQGFQATGVELNRWLVYYSRLAAWRAGWRRNWSPAVSWWPAGSSSPTGRPIRRLGP